MLEDLPNKVKNYIFIRYEDLINDFDKTLLKIKDKGLEIKKNVNSIQIFQYFFGSSTDTTVLIRKRTYSKYLQRLDRNTSNDDIHGNWTL